MSRVTGVEVMDVQPIGSSKSTFEVKWKMSAETEHWCHVHLRTSQYKARLTMSANQDKQWKLQKFQVLDEQRLAFETSIRGYDSNP